MTRPACYAVGDRVRVNTLGNAHGIRADAPVTVQEVVRNSFGQYGYWIVRDNGGRDFCPENQLSTLTLN